MTRRLVTLGETMAALRATETGGARIGDLFELDAAGAESNVAIGVARLGGSAHMVGRVGNDDAGRAIARALRGEGVEPHLVIDLERPTGLLLATSPRPGRTRVSYGRARSAGSRLAADDVPADLIRPHDIVHLTGITPAVSESCRDAARAVAALAHDRGARLSLDVNYRAALWTTVLARETLVPIAEGCEVVFAGVDEAALLLGDPHGDSRRPQDLAADLLSLGIRTAVVTDGPRGAWCAVADGGLHFQPAFAVEAIDTSGAGDAFVAGYLAGLLDERPMHERLIAAAACGALACEGRGDWRRAPTRSDLEAFIASSAGAAVDPVER